jgi:hypothetical protein
MELNLKASSAKVTDYYSALNQFGQLNISHETAVRQAFAGLLDSCAKQFKWKLVQEFRPPAPKNKSIIVDGAVLDAFTLKHGFWPTSGLPTIRELIGSMSTGWVTVVWALSWTHSIANVSPEVSACSTKGIHPLARAPMISLIVWAFVCRSCWHPWQGRALRHCRLP